MKRRTARKVIKYGMDEVRGRYGTYLKAIEICPRLSNLLHFKKIFSATKTDPRPLQMIDATKQIEDIQNRIEFDDPMLGWD